MVPVLVMICVLSSGAVDAVMRVFGGRDVDPQDYPYVVRLEMKIMLKQQDTYSQFFTHMCTASVLTPIWTLTAGHCITFDEFTSAAKAVRPSATISYVIRYGLISSYISPFENVIDIIKSVKHPAYKILSTKNCDSVANDVGLAKTMPIKLHQYGKLSAVEYTSLVGHEAVAMGYGLMQREKLGTTLSFRKPLQVLDVLIKSCTKDLKSGSISPTICISTKCRQISSLCPGDSGGPLVHFSGVVGINHMAHPGDCTLQSAKDGVSSNLVAIITPVGPYIQWIADQISANEVM